MSAPKRAGDRGERAVAAFLKRRGYTLLDRQWRCRQGELDLVALDGGGTLLLCGGQAAGEWGDRPSQGVCGQPQAIPTARCAACYISARALDVPARFDVGGGL